MKFYWVKTNRFIKILFRRFVWSVPTDDKVVYLTFDDGPTPEITDWVLNQLKQFNAKATFFCIGNNIRNNPELFDKILACKHRIGNHTQNHLNGWHTSDKTYIENIRSCNDEINSRNSGTDLFRPPYGKLKSSQSAWLRDNGYKIVMWDILSADFDRNITPEKCLNNVIRNINPGSIIIFHDSVKAFPNLEFALPRTLQFLKENGFECRALS